MNYWTLDETTYKYFYVVDGEINWGQPSPGDEVQVNENLSYIVPVITSNTSITHSPSELEFYSVEAERYR